MSETIITRASTQVAAAAADLKEVQSYIVDAKSALKEATAYNKAVVATTKAYAPRVVDGVKWLNKNCRGWINGLATESDLGYTIKLIPSDLELQALGFEPDPKVAKRTKVDETVADSVLDALWQTAQDIQQGKKSVTLARLLKRAGVQS